MLNSSALIALKLSSAFAAVKQKVLFVERLYRVLTQIFRESECAAAGAFDVPAARA
jgi:hypothetical protein